VLEPLEPKLKIEAEQRINCAVWGPVNEMIIAGCDDGSLSVYSTKDGSEIASSKEHKGTIKSISTSKDKMLFITASSDNTAKLFETKTLDVIKSYRSGEPVNAAAISPLKYHVCNFEFYSSSD
jgi:translation initiation factor 3 subunit I